MSDFTNLPANEQFDDIPPALEEIIRILYEFKRETNSCEFKERQRKKQEMLRRAKLEGRVKRRWKKIEKLERERKLPVYLWIVASRRMEEEAEYGLAVWYATGGR